MTVLVSAIRWALGWRRTGGIPNPPPTPTVTLQTLSLSGTLTHNLPSTGRLAGATAGSLFSFSGTLPNGLVFSGSNYTWSGAGTGTFSFNVTESNSTASNSPLTTTIGGSIGAGSSPANIGQPLGLLLALTKAS